MASQATTETDTVLDVSIDTSSRFSLESGSLDVICAVKPWQRGSVILRHFTEGITNKLVGGYVKEDTDDIVLVRVYGENTDLFLDRNAEVENIKLLSKLGLGPAFHCRFANGIAYDFVPGRIVTEKTCRDAAVYSLIAREMARFHKVSLSSRDDGGEKRPILWDRIEKFLEIGPDSFPDPVRQKKFAERVMTKSALRLELDGLRKSLEACGSPVVFCHNDALLANIVHQEKEQRVFFIDLEYGAPSFRAFDIGNHFCEWVGVGLDLDYSTYPDKSEQLPWLKEYLKEYNDSKDVDESELEKLYKRVNKFALAAHFLWGLWSLVQAKYSSIDFDFLGYAIVRLNEYQARKEEFLAL